MRTPWTALAGALLLAGASGALGATVADVVVEDPLWGEPLDVEAFRERVVVLYFWAAD
jgi:hypothetical protein